MAALPEFIQDGIRYVPTKLIAKSVGLSPRYIADFCREGRVAGVFHKGAWYVEETSLRRFLEQRTREQEEYNRRLSQEAKEETERNARAAAAERTRLAKESLAQRRWQAAITTGGVTLATFTLLFSVGMAFEMLALPNSIARVNLVETIASARARVGAVSAGAQEQLAAVSSLPWLDGFAENFYRAVCPLFRDCPREDLIANPLPRPMQPLPKKLTTPTATTSKPASATPSEEYSAPTTVIDQPVIERIREVRTVEASTNAAYVDARIAALAASVQRQMDAMADANATSFRSVSQSSGGSSGLVAASNITGTITNAIDSAVGTFLDLTTNTLTASNATTTNLYVSGTATIGSATGVLQSNAGAVSAISTGSNGQVLKLVGGAPTWSTDLQGSGGGSSAWATSSDDLLISPSDTTDVDVIGSNATSTTGNILETVGNSLFRGTLTSYFNLTAPRFTATSSQASILPFASSTALTVSGTGYFGAASTTALTISGASGGILKTDAAGIVSVATLGTDYLSPAASIEDLSDVAAMTKNYGDLFAWNGSAWADFATSSLAIALSDTTGTLGATRGGTGLSSITAAGILLGNYAGTGWQQLATSTLGLLTTHVAEGSNLYFTDARVQSFVHASTTIPKTYTANTFTGLQTFGNASTTLLSSSYASSTLYFGAGLTDCASENMLTWTSGRFGCESDTAGGGGASDPFTHPWPTASATTSLMLFSGGASTTLFSTLDALYVGRSATTTIRGDGVASILPYASTTALSVSGTAYFPGSGIWNSSGNVGIGTTTPGNSLTVAGGNLQITGTGANGTNPYMQNYGTGGRTWRWIASQTGDTLHGGLGLFDATGAAYRVAVTASGNVGIGTTTPERPLDVLLSDSATNVSRDVQALILKSSSGAGAAGFGPRLTFNAETATEGTIDQAAGIAGVWENPTAGSVDGALAFYTRVNSGSFSERMRINASGNVGIGTTSPNGILSIEQGTETNSLWIGNQGSSTPSLVVKGVNGNGKVGIGSNTLNYNLVVRDENNNAKIGALTIGRSGGEYHSVGYNVRYGSTPDAYTYDGGDTASMVRFNSGKVETFTAGVGTAGNSISFTTGPYVAQGGTSWTSGSDARMKSDIAGVSVLDRLDAFRAVSYVWNQSGRRELGVVAQELYAVFPELVKRGSASLSAPTSSDDIWGVEYDRLGPLALQGVKELNLKLEDLATTTPEIAEGSFPFRFFAALKERLLAWFADATNGIKSFFAERVQTKELCVDDVCVTRDQFAEVFGGSQSAAAAGASSSGVAPEAPANSSAAINQADAATTTTLSDSGPTASAPLSSQSDATDAVLPPEPADAANDNETNTSSDPLDPAGSSAPAANDQPADAPSLEAPEPANDNSPAEPQAATGTDG